MGVLCIYKEDKYYILLSCLLLLFRVEGTLLLFCWIGRKGGDTLKIKGLTGGGYIIGVV